MRIAQPADVYLGIPHRLDRPVSGAILFAKTRRAARQLSRQLERRRVKKIYWACVERAVEPLSGTWTDYLYKVHGQPRAAVVEASHPDGLEAILHYRTRGFHAAGSWLEIELETGRTHQIRVQSATRGHPILGDEHYGARITFGPPQPDERQRIDRAPRPLDHVLPPHDQRAGNRRSAAECRVGRIGADTGAVELNGA